MIWLIKRKVRSQLIFLLFDYEQQIFEKFFKAIYLLSEFLPETCWEAVADNFRYNSELYELLCRRGLVSSVSAY